MLVFFPAVIHARTYCIHFLVRMGKQQMHQLLFQHIPWNLPLQDFFNRSQPSKTPTPDKLDIPNFHEIRSIKRIHCRINYFYKSDYAKRNCSSKSETRGRMLSHLKKSFLLPLLFGDLNFRRWQTQFCWQSYSCWHIILESLYAALFTTYAHVYRSKALKHTMSIAGKWVVPAADMAEGRGCLDQLVSG